MSSGFPDSYILERRVQVVRELPLAIPASVLLELTDADLDRLDMAQDRDAYWRTLNAIVARVQTSGRTSERGCGAMMQPSLFTRGLTGVTKVTKIRREQ